MNNNASPALLQACALVCSILGCQAPASGVEHLQLEGLYSQHPHLSVAPIQHPQFIKLLISSKWVQHGLSRCHAHLIMVCRACCAITCILMPCCPPFPDAAGIFTPTKVLPSDAIAAAIELLARATSCRDQGFDGQDSGAQHELGEEGTEEEAAAAARMDTTREALQAALDTAQRALTKTGLQDAMVIYQVECGKSMGLACWLVMALTQHVSRVTF